MDRLKRSSIRKSLFDGTLLITLLDYIAGITLILSASFLVFLVFYILIWRLLYG